MVILPSEDSCRNGNNYFPMYVFGKFIYVYVRTCVYVCVYIPFGRIYNVERILQRREAPCIRNSCPPPKMNALCLEGSPTCPGLLGDVRI